MIEKKLWLVRTTEVGSEWEMTGGVYIVEAVNQDEIKKMKFGFGEKVVEMTNMKHLKFNYEGVHTVHESMQL